MKKKVSKKRKSSAARPSQTNDKSLREHLLYLLRDGGAPPVLTLRSATGRSS
jgi:hypothetical protein